MICARSGPTRETGIALASTVRSLTRTTAAVVSIDRGPLRKDQIVAKFDLRKEQPVFDARLLPFSGSKERSQLREPFASAVGEVASRQ